MSGSIRPKRAAARRILKKYMASIAKAKTTSSAIVKRCKIERPREPCASLVTVHETHLLFEPRQRHLARRSTFRQCAFRRDAAFKLRDTFAQPCCGFVHRGIIAGLRAGIERIERLPHQHRSRVHPRTGLLFDLAPF